MSPWTTAPWTNGQKLRLHYNEIEKNIILTKIRSAQHDLHLIKTFASKFAAMNAPTRILQLNII